MTDDIDLDKMMAEIFGSTPKQEEQTFYLWYNNLNSVVGFGPTFIDDYKDYDYITINKEWFETLSNSNLHNFIIDTEKQLPVDISGNDLIKNVNLHKAGPWSERLIQMQFVKSTRQIHVKCNTQLPSEKVLWIVPHGNYTVPLLTLKLSIAQEQVIDVPNWGKSKSCECISNQPIDIFTAYREVENETDL